ncbi:MAG: potassium channel protein [Planctomycetota bacterium]
MYVRRILGATVAVFTLLVIGVVGYVLIEGYSLIDALYMSVITISTVGFGEVRELSSLGRLFTVLLILIGVGLLAYGATQVAQAIVEGKLREAFGRFKVERKIRELQGHIIVCGFGRVGQNVCTELSAGGTPFVVIERDEERCRRAHELGFLALQGDATEDDVLLQAGIRSARALSTVLPEDTQNVFISLSARELNPKIFIIARSNEETTEIKLRRAGADRIVTPASLGARRIAQAILRPAVVDFIDITTGQHNFELRLEELMISPDSPLAGQSILESQIRQNLDVMIVAIKKPSGELRYNLKAESVIETGDILIALGELGRIKRLELLTAGDRENLPRVPATEE